jgi:ubiquinone/menaquinone biosynthesis C-methylase UbiE
MLLETSRRDRESFVNAAGERLPIANQSVDLVTLAGSLNYIERDPLVEELSRISREGAEVVVYDFDIDLSDCEDFLGIDTRVEPGSYDHSVNLSDYEELTEVSVVEDEHSIDLSHEEISHLLLSDRGRYDALRRKFAVSNPEESVREELRLTRRAGSVRSRIFYSVYSMESVCGGRGQERGKG